MLMSVSVVFLFQQPLNWERRDGEAVLWVVQGVTISLTWHSNWKLCHCFVTCCHSNHGYGHNSQRLMSTFSPIFLVEFFPLKLKATVKPLFSFLLIILIYTYLYIFAENRSVVINEIILMYMKRKGPRIHILHETCVFRLSFFEQDTYWFKTTTFKN